MPDTLRAHHPMRGVWLFVVKFMALSIKHKIIFTLLVCSLFSATKTLACDCPLLTSEQAVEQSKAVFSGEVIGFEYRKGIPIKS